MLLLYVGLIQNKAHSVARGQVAIMVVDGNEREAKWHTVTEILAICGIHTH
jgi:hypothetical protein